MWLRNIEWRNDYLIITAIVLVALLVGFLPAWMPVQAAPPAPVEVKECQKTNTATLASGVTIEFFYCKPELGAPFKANSFGFMLPEEQ